MAEDLEKLKKSKAPATFGQVVKLTDAVAEGMAAAIRAHDARLARLEEEVAELRRLIEADR